MSVTRKEITKGVVLTSRRNESNSEVSIEVSSTVFLSTRLTLDYEGSTNLEFEDGGRRKVIDLKPYDKAKVGVLRAIDPSKMWTMRARFVSQPHLPEPGVVNSAVESDEKKIMEELSVADELQFGADSATLDDIAALCKKAGRKFIDVEFPPTEDSLYGPTSDNRPAPGRKEITWRRASEFLGVDHKVFASGISPSDISQGLLGDCWFLCSIAALAEHPEYVTRLFEDADPGKQSRSEIGAYKVRFCKNGEWVTFRVDDYFPCAPGAGPVYSKNHGRELWVLLLEKAYAKAHGTYETLEGGLCFEALIDLTGCPTTWYRFNDAQVSADIKSGRFWDMLVKFDEARCLITASTSGEDKWTKSGGAPVGGPGLVSGHAYTIIQARNAPGGHKLVQIRNPWGRFEWRGDWSDSSDLWTAEIKEALGFVPNPDDGLFWMSFDDLIRYFVRINVCRTRPGGGGGRWNEARRKGRFTVRGGMLQTNAYVLSLTSRGTVWLSIHQEDDRAIASQPYIDVGVTIVRTRPDGTREFIGSTGLEADRQAQVELTLDAGEYTVIPYTTGCKLGKAAGGESKSEKPVDLSEGSQLSAACEAALRTVFRSLDEDMDGVLNRDEVNVFSRMTEGHEMDDVVYQWMMDTFDSTDEGITADGFVEIYAYLWAASGYDQAMLWRDLRLMGFNDALVQVNARAFVVSVHSEAKSELFKVPCDSELFEEALTLPVMHLGNKRELKNFSLYTLQGVWGVSLVVKNTTDSRLEVILDCSKRSTNVMSHTGKLTGVAVLEPGQFQGVLHMMPIKQAGYSWNLSVESRFL